MILKSPLGLIKDGSFGDISLLALSVNAYLDNASSKCSDQSVSDIKNAWSCISTDVFPTPFLLWVWARISQLRWGYFLFSMHLAIVILNSPGESGNYRLLKDKLVEMNAVVIAKCQLSYHGMTGSDHL